MKSFLTISLFFYLSTNIFAQETIGDYNIIYNISLNKLKTQSQEKNIEQEIKKISNVTKCDVDPINYNLYISLLVDERNKNQSFIDQVKMILISDGVEIIEIERSINK